ncbi:hypothetical protein ACT3CE_03320 [Marinifilum sp. RC60d5]|uniref:hypothetical protein n=1 Tax=Marinifilum sp. RC60d5 TaxID=3458414 RepID=UPI004036ABEF
MDEGWGNIIYLIAMAIFIVYGALKKKKPAKVIIPDEEEIFDQQEQPAQQPNTDFESILGTLLGQEISKPYAQTEDLDAETSSFEQKVIVKEEKRVSSVTQEKKEEKRSVFDDLKNLYEQEEEEIEEDEEETIDWRQAIIYKEILDRKYQ